MPLTLADGLSCTAGNASEFHCDRYLNLEHMRQALAVKETVAHPGIDIKLPLLECSPDTSKEDLYNMKKGQHLVP